MTNNQFIQKLLNLKLLSTSESRLKYKTNAQTKRAFEQRPALMQELLELTSYTDVEFSTLERLYLILNNSTTQPKCIFCGKSVGFHSAKDKVGLIKEYCDSKCSNRCPIRNKKFEETCLDRYGVSRVQETEELKNKRKSTMVERYGVDVPMKSESLRNKIIQTNREKYGVDFPLMKEEIYQKARESNIENHGGVLSTQDEACKKKIRQSFLNRYGVGHPSRIDHPYIESFELVENKDWLIDQHYTQKKSYTEIANDIGLSVTAVCRWGKNHNISVRKYNTSVGEKKLFEYVKSLLTDFNVVSSTREIISPKELDIYVPSHNLAIEYNGSFWHSEARGRDNLYHLNKTTACLEKDINLFHIFDFEWEEHQDTVKSMIKNYLNLNHTINANDLVLSNLDRTTATQFLKENSLEDFNFDMCYALKFESDIIAAIYSFDNIVKYVTKNYFNVDNGFDLLFKHIQSISSQNPWLYITDLRFQENPTTYGFIPLEVTDPQPFQFGHETAWDCGYMVWMLKS